MIRETNVPSGVAGEDTTESTSKVTSLLPVPLDFDWSSLFVVFILACVFKFGTIKMSERCVYRSAQLTSPT